MISTESLPPEPIPTSSKKRRVSEILQDVIKWPEETKKSKQVRRKELTPTVVTSKVWIEMNEAKQSEKFEIEKEKEERKKEREEKKRIMNEEKAKKKMLQDMKKSEKIKKKAGKGCKKAKD